MTSRRPAVTRSRAGRTGRSAPGPPGRHLDPRLGAGQGAQGPRVVDLLGHPSTQAPLGPLARRLSPGHVDFLRPLGPLGEDGDPVGTDLREAPAHREVVLLPPAPVAHLADAHQREEGGMAGQDAEVAVDAGDDDLPEQAFYMVGTIEEAVERAQRLRE